MSWSVPREWDGERCFILGGGASLKGFDAERLRGRGRVIAIKEAGLTMAPWADVLYWADAWWHDGKLGFKGERHRLHLHTGKWKIARSKPNEDTLGHDIKVVGREEKEPLSRDPSRVAGPDSGSHAVNLAYLFGAAPIVLLGYDMGGKNWDGRPRKAETNGRYRQVFIPAMEKMAAALKQAGAEVLNATPESALECFPKIELEALL